MIEPDDLLSPTGPIDPSFFPGVSSETLSSTLAAYILDASARVGALPSDQQDEATRAWALWRAFDAISLRLITTPASASIEGEGSRAYNSAQAQLMRKRADEQLLVFRSFALQNAEAAGSTVQQQTGAIAIDFAS